MDYINPLLKLPAAHDLMALPPGSAWLWPRAPLPSRND